MLGRYVPQLEFVAVLLGDKPALEMNVSFFQRLLARDQDEAEDLILERLKADPQDQVFDSMLVPALRSTRDSRNRGEIAGIDEQAILQSIREITLDIGDILAGSGEPGAEHRDHESSTPSPHDRAAVIFGCPARDDVDFAGLEMLEKLLDADRWRMKLIASQTLTSELLEMVAHEKPDVICIAAILPGGRAHTRYLCKRLHARFPDLRIIVGRWGSGTPDERATEDLEKAGASGVGATLVETRQQLQSLLPILVADRSDWNCTESAESRRAVTSHSHGSLHRAAMKEVAARSALP
jgi:hypothetical protein